MILYIIGFLLLIGILAKVFDFLKAVLPYVFGIVAIGIVIMLFPAILSVLGVAFPILLVLFAIGVVGLVVQAVMYRPFLDKLENAGILDKRALSGEEKAIAYAIENKKALEMGANYLLSAKLLEGIENRLNNRDVIAKTDVISAVCKRNITDSSEMLSGLLSYMDHDDILIPLGDNCYITRRLCQYCQTLLEREGAATMEEFSDICALSELSGNAKTRVRQVSNAALQWMVRQNTANITDLPEIRTVLYVAQNRKNSKMVQRVINLDEDD